MNKKILLIGYSYWIKIIANQLNNTKGIEFFSIQDNNPTALKEFTKQFPSKKYFKNLVKKYAKNYISIPAYPKLKKNKLLKMTKVINAFR